jgi:hypothetical protein
MQKSQLDEVVHRVNNLLGTIQIQAEVARGDGSAEAYAAAMACSVESARRTRAELVQLVPGRGDPRTADGS